ncbi:MAG: hypothetical protein Phyf2KO_18460 [Phycisphaerales bacterium]
MKCVYLTVAFLFALSVLHTDAQSVWYVDNTAISAGNGSSWQSPFLSIYDAVDASAPGDEIWIRTGTYEVDLGTIDLSADLVLRGGFLGDETDISQRNIRKNSTIITGDLLGDDSSDPSSRSDNTDVTMISGGALINGVVVRGAAYQAMLTDARLIDCVVDDCILTIGEVPVVEMRPAAGESISVERCEFANCARMLGNDLKGVLYVRVSDHTSELSISDSEFHGNGHIGEGASTSLAIDAYSTDVKGKLVPVTIERCMFRDNKSVTFQPAALFMYLRETDAAVDNCDFLDNDGGIAGAAMLDCDESKTVIRDSVFLSNGAHEGGGGALTIRQGNGDQLLSDKKTLIQDCHFEANSASFGGAVSLDVDAGFGLVTVDRCVFTANKGDEGAAIQAFGMAGSILVRDSLIERSEVRDPSYGPGSIIAADHALFYGCKILNHDSIGYIVDDDYSVFASSIIRENRFTVPEPFARLTFLHSVFWNNYAKDGVTRLEPSGSFLNCVLDSSPAESSCPESSAFPGAAAVCGNLDLDLLGQVFVDPDSGDFRPMAGSALIDSGADSWGDPNLISNTFDLVDLDSDGVRAEFIPIDAKGAARNQDTPNAPGSGPDIGPFEFGDALPDTSPCIADLNGDGFADSDDFIDWRSAYLAGDVRADQNLDGLVSPTDFTAWISNVQRGCH